MAKVVWITGASSGIGKGLTELYNKRGDKLIISSRSENNLNQVKSSSPYPDNIIVLPLDISNYENMSAIVKKATGLWGQVDLLINNAGVSQRSLIIDTNIDVYKKLIDVNYLGTVALSKALLPHFIERQQGQFVVVSSLMGKFSSPYRSGYCGAKHALHGFFDSLRMEHEKDNIKVTIICPGFVQTNVAKNALIGDGSKQNSEDEATKNGLSVSEFCNKMMAAIDKGKFEAYIAGKEKKGVYVKRFFPKLLHKLVLKSQVR